ncbi:hypothetical protein A2276_08140 [candidate division WOR-1 bacterium RIFOXYA12_FULL_43_27]|nr:MAG: hypothetical protein A2276_08140 [candidate division WOR-1 bacterium RIFOXYA12_FULL_43_27]OGC20565.1 MAG: hypothetical protein A2292_05965 [candidate division WOR-1 bacterium RIFOXYB2_FULL_46_45]OGC31698.1 MAG: hypothetical protein A2232_05485 [candidate division WOR-1 bacterium RIFOXYA2_FULL_46_56]
MDATTVIVILVFTFSIISGVTNQKDAAKRAASNPVPATSYTEYIKAPDASVIPGPNYADGVIPDLSDRINRFIMGYARVENRPDTSSITDSIVKYSEQYNVNPLLLTSLIARESRFNKYAISSSGAMGLGQLLQSTCATVKISDPFDIDQNVKGTARYLRHCLDRFSKTSPQVPFAIAGYLEGPGNIERNSGYKPTSKPYVEDILKIYNKI